MSDTPSKPAVEGWQRHARCTGIGGTFTDPPECVECSAPWPCDIAKAINYGIDFGRMAERFSPGARHEVTDDYLEIADRILPRLRLALARAMSEEGL